MIRDRTVAGLALCLLAPLAVGFLGSLFTRASVDTWYQELAKPSFTPPGWVFGPVWTALYLAMGLAAFLVLRERGLAGARTALALFGAQLLLNLAWSGIFFGLRSPGPAFAEILLLLAAVAATAVVFWRIRPLASVLLWPYLLWTSFAAVLNLAIWRMNA